MCDRYPSPPALTALGLRKVLLREAPAIEPGYKSSLRADFTTDTDTDLGTLVLRTGAALLYRYKGTYPARHICGTPATLPRGCTNAQHRRSDPPYPYPDSMPGLIRQVYLTLVRANCTGRTARVRPSVWGRCQALPGTQRPPRGSPGSWKGFPGFGNSLFHHS